METTIMGYIGIIGYILGLYRDYIGYILGLYRDYIRIMEKKMETTIQGLKRDYRVYMDVCQDASNQRTPSSKRVHDLQEL